MSRWNTNDNKAQMQRLADSLRQLSIDITSTYQQWVVVALALANAFGADGEDLFCDFSSSYPKYDAEACRRKYRQCLHRADSGQRKVGLGTIVYYAHQAGYVSENLTVPPLPISDKDAATFAEVNYDEPVEETHHDESQYDTFSDKIDATTLPSLLQGVLAEAYNPEDADLLLLGALTCFSSCLPNVSGIYDGREVYPNLYTFVSAMASSGKGRLTLCRHLVEPVHQLLRQAYNDQKARYEQEMIAFNAARGSEAVEHPEEPKLTTLFMPANSSATAIYQLLDANGGNGFIMETEGDTLAGVFKQDYGDYSDGFRKAYHHEPISYARRKDHEFVELRHPRLSVLLSGTPAQIHNLIPDAENGLFSRFLFYHLSVRLEWRDVFASSDHTADDAFTQLGERFFLLYKTLISSPHYHFSLSETQAQRFNAFFSEQQRHYSELRGLGFIANVRRQGLSAFRIAMICSTLHIGDLQSAETPRGASSPTRHECSDADLDTALTISEVLLRHAALVYDEMPTPDAENNEKRAPASKTLLEMLPEQFMEQQYYKLATTLGLSEATAKRYLMRYLSKGQIVRKDKKTYERRTVTCH